MTNHLNPQQKEAVEHGEGPLLVLAGAGTGKTRVLTHRIVHLIQTGAVFPQQILGVTFTNKAAQEMRHRIGLMMEGGARDVWIGTFHSTCLRILRQFSEKAGFSPNFLVYDERDQLSLLKDILNQKNLDEKRFPASFVLNRISRFKDQLQGPKDVLKLVGDPFQELLGKVYQSYNEELQKNNAMDFGDLIFHCVALFKKEAEILRMHQKRWKYVLVDEYQDTNHAQYQWIHLLSREHRNLCVVGDDDQSIYRWRGADIGNILNFEKDYPGTRVIRLEQNYRSTQNILVAAGHVIANNTERKGKTLWTQNEAGKQIALGVLTGEEEEAEFIVSRMQQAKTEGLLYKDMACFYRTNAQSRPLEEALQRARIPYQIYGGMRFYERAEIKDALAYLRLILNPSDPMSIKRILDAPPRGIGATTVEKIENLSLERSVTFFESMQLLCTEQRVGTAVLKKLHTFIHWLQSLPSWIGTLSLTELLQKILEESGYMAWLQGKSPIEAEDRLANINELIAGLADFSERSPEATLNDYLDQVTLTTSLDQQATDGAISMMTLHLAKGLEFPWVVIAGLEEGLLPHNRSLDSPEELEEERRLMYVGMTRARKQLLLTHAWKRFVNGTSHYGLASRFLEEIPEEYCEVIRKSRAQISVPDSDEDWDFDQRPAEERTPAKSSGDFFIGCQVQHPQFGLGTVRASEQTMQGERVTVQFYNGPLCKLIAEYANLKKA